jgi:hypothetical protein
LGFFGKKKQIFSPCQNRSKNPDALNWFKS